MPARTFGNALMLAILLFLFPLTNSVLANTGFDYELDGTSGDDELLGTAGSDLIDGKAGADTIYGFSGNDQLIGGDGEDRLQGGNGSTTGSDNDILIGGSDNDILMGEDGNDSLQGGTGDDHYYYTSGQDTVIDLEDGYDILFFLQAAKSELSFHQSGNDLLVIVNDDEANSVTVSHFFTETDAKIHVQPNGGYLIPASDIPDLITDQGETDEDDPDEGNEGGGASNDEIPQSAIAGTDKEDIVVGSDNSDVLFGDVDNDILIGGAGNDDYYIRSGDGQDQIWDTSGFNRIQFTESIATSDVTSGFYRYDNDLVLKIGSGDQQVSVQSFFTVANTVSELVFADGQIITSDQIYSIYSVQAPETVVEAPVFLTGSDSENFIIGTTASDVILTGMSADQLQPLTGDDILIGGEGDDQYQISANGGMDTIIDSSGSNTIVFASEINFSDVMSNLYRYDNDLVLSYGDENSNITVYQFFSRLNTINELSFLSGANTISAEDLWSSFGAQTPTNNAIIYDKLTGVSSDDGDSDDDRDSISNSNDQCPLTPEDETANENGCSPSQLDTDADGIDDARDECPDTDESWTVNEIGCSPQQLDSDSDGVMDSDDQCEATPMDESVDESGCSESQKDEDNDGVPDYLDLCPDTSSVDVDENGCGAYQLDDDNDGISNAVDACPDTQTDWTVNESGCAANQLDSDSDGITDDIDEDIDGDGVANVDDAFPYDSSEQLDSDGDGQGNNTDEDDDNDSYTDTEETNSGTDVLDWQSNPWVIKTAKSYVPQTGEKVVFYQGDDASLRNGIPQIFHRNDELEIVYDLVNGLVWQDNEQVASKGWGSCDDLVFAGITDWRVPNRLELLSIIQSYKESSGESYFHPVFENEFLKTYISLQYNYQTKNLEHKNGGISPYNTVDILSGRLATATWDYYTGGYKRCVSGEEKFVPNFSRIDRLDVSIDMTSKLMFEDGIQIESNYGTIEQAIHYCNELEFAGYDDWRVPNSNESQILLYEFDSKATDVSLPDTVDYVSSYTDSYSDRGYWWSSTPHFGNARYKPSAHTETSINGFWKFKYRDFGNEISGLYGYANPLWLCRGFKRC